MRMFGPIRLGPNEQILQSDKEGWLIINLSTIAFHSPPSEVHSSSNRILKSYLDNCFSTMTRSVVRSTSSSARARRSRRNCFILSACFRRNSVTILGNGHVRILIVTSPLGEVIVAVPLLTEESFNAAISTINRVSIRNTWSSDDRLAKWDNRLASRNIYLCKSLSQIF